MNAHDDSLVRTVNGPIRGRLRTSADAARILRPTHVFLGIPYARATRFGAPEPVQAWRSAKETVAPAPIAPQRPSGLDRLIGMRDHPQSETECLALNVWTAGIDDRRRPVMVWIHGGGFATGSGTVPWYDGTRFAANHDVVVVSLNYRLGVLGFLEVDGTDRAPTTAVSNRGLLDQVAALQWVRENIAAFGGDPDNVTVFGESAGAMSIGALLAMPSADGLFRRAIMQSGAASHVHTMESATHMAARVQAAAGAEGLHRLDVGELLSAQATIGATGSGRLPYQPVIDGRILPASPLSRLREGASRDVELLIGTTADEMRLFTALDPAVQLLDQRTLRDRLCASSGMTEARADAMIELYAQNRPCASCADLWAAITTDMVFRAPAHRLLEAAHAANPHRVAWQYLFRWPTPAFGGGFRSCHALELPFVFDNLDKPGIDLFTGVGAERQGIADRMHASWAAFARRGDPRAEGFSAHESEPWIPWETERRATMVFDTRCEVLERPSDDELGCWE